MSFYHNLHLSRRAAAFFACLLVVIGVWTGLTATASVYAQEVEPSSVHRAAINDLLAQDLEQAAGPVSFLAVLREQANAETLLASGELQAASAQDRRAALYRALTAHAERTQAPLRAWLDARGVRYTPHYLVNMIEVEGDQELAEQLRLRPEVDRLARNPAIRQAEALDVSRLWPQFATTMAVAPPTELPYGLTYTKADQAWELGIRGQGVVVASQDTGVKWDHPALRGAYRGWNAQTQTATHIYNWYDAFGRNQQDMFIGCSPDPQVPCDDSNHGTHTVGTMVGDATAEGGAILGMAPAAEWVGCRNIRGGVGTPASYTACFEWFMAPYPQGGNPFTDGKPELAPTIINNSWGCPPKEGCDADSLRQVVDTVRAAGLFIAASAGNENQLNFGSPKCNTVSNPIAIYDSSFSVGAHDQSGNIASFSSRGPVSIDGSNRLKPDLTAPGIFVISSVPGGYAPLSGTSMSSPHVAGAVALLWSVAPELVGDIDRTEQILRDSATPVINGDCDPAPATPNNVYGYGRLNVMQAILDARPPATATVVLVGAGSPPLAALPVRFVSDQTGFVYAATTGTDGKVQLPSVTSSQPLLSGDYTVQVPQCLGFMEAGKVTLAPNQETQVKIDAPSTVCRYLPLLSK